MLLGEVLQCNIRLEETSGEEHFEHRDQQVQRSIHPIVGREGTTESDSRSGTQPQRNSKGFGFSF